jgi:SH3-like domain-containing protein
VTVNSRLLVWISVAVSLGLSGVAFGQTTPPTPPAKSKPTPEKSAAKPSSKPAAKKEEPKPAPAPEPQPGAADAAPDAAATASAPSLPIPRFVSFRGDPVNARTGPGMRYPVDWIYMRRRLPVEIIAESENWRQIRDPDGSEVWVHQSMVTGRRTGVIKGQPQDLRKTNTDVSDTLAILEPGVIVDVVRCPEGVFCRVEVNGVQGWLKRNQFWGVYPQEIIE